MSVSQLVPLITAGTVTTGPSGTLAVNAAGAYITIWVKAGAGVSAGAVTIEEADDAAYAGTWAIIGSAVSTAAASITQAVHITGTYRYIRVRISTNITGGSVDVTGQVGVP
jgi:hypothetical protein